MKAINKICGMLAVGITLIFGSCTEEAEYAKAGIPAGDQVYFANTLGNKISLKKENTSFTVELNRIKTDAAVTVNLKVTNSSNNISVPSSVTFAAGATTAQLAISYTPGKMEYDEFSKITLAIEGEEYTTPYGNSAYTFEAGIPAPWTSLGMATYVDGYVSGAYGLEPPTYQLEIQKNDLTPGLYRLVNPYGEGFPYASPGSYDASQNYYMEINAVDPEAVYITLQSMGVHYGTDGTFFVYSEAAYMLDSGKSMEDVKKAGVCGVLANGILRFPVDKLFFTFEGSKDLYYANRSGEFTLAMPGYALTDYTATVAYTGRFTTASGANYAIANVKLGEDVQYARVAMIKGTSATAQQKAVEGIIAGTVESQELSENGEVRFACNAAGQYSFVVVTYGEDKAQDSSVGMFEFTMDSEIRPIEDYENSYIVSGTYYDKENNLLEMNTKVTLTKDALENEDGSFTPVLVADGLIGFDSYKSPVLLVYDEATGRVVLPPQDSEKYKDDYAAFCPVTIAGRLTLEETMVGHLNGNGDLVFENALGNTIEWDSFSFITIQGEEAALLSPFYSLTWIRDNNTESSAASSFVRSMPMTGMKKLDRVRSTNKNAISRHMKCTIQQMGVLNRDNIVR